MDTRFVRNPLLRSLHLRNGLADQFRETASGFSPPKAVRCHLMGELDDLRRLPPDVCCIMDYRVRDFSHLGSVKHRSINFGDDAGVYHCILYRDGSPPVDQ